MPARACRHIELLQLSAPLRRYAGSLNSDANATSLLVHHALSAAFVEPDLRPSVGLEASLRADINRSWALSQANLAGANWAVPSSTR